MTSSNCSVCNSPTVRISRLNHLDAETRFSWESDSTFALSGMKEADVDLRFCWKCLRTVIYPVFDTAVLYGENGLSVRKRIYEQYHPGGSYSSAKHGRTLQRVASLLANDFRRFYKVCSFIAAAVKSRDLSEISILDYGGGDGYVAKMLATAISSIAGLKVSTSVYELAASEAQTGTNTGQFVSGASTGKPSTAPGEKFHLVLVSHVLEHSHDPVGIIMHASRYLDSDGVLLCEVPDERLNVLRALLGKRFGLHYHVTHFSSRSLYEMLSAAGLANISAEYHLNSSYRGNRCRSIVGAAQLKDETAARRSHPESGRPSLPREILSFAVMLLYAIFHKLFRRT